MARLTEVRDSLAGVLSAAVPSGLTYARTPDAIVTPAVVVVVATPFAGYQRAMDNATTALFRFEVTILTGRLAEQPAQVLLDDWASPDGPILAALWAAAIVDAEVLTVAGQQYGTFRFGAAEYLGFSLTVEIEA